MSDNPTVSNSYLSNNPDYIVETDDQGGGVQRQVVKVAEMPAVTLTASSVSITKTALTPASNSSFSVTGVSAQAVAVNASRKGLIITNLTANVDVFLTFDGTAALNTGIALLGQGATFNMGEYDFTTNAVHAIGSSSATIAIQEFS